VVRAPVLVLMLLFANWKWGLSACVIEARSSKASPTIATGMRFIGDSPFVLNLLMSPAEFARSQKKHLLGYPLNAPQSDVVQTPQA
jgi:hypothetical protein